MEHDRRPPPPMEVLDAERAPSMVERHLAPLLRRRGVQAGLALLVLAVGGWVVAPTGSDRPVPPRDGGEAAAPGPSEPPGSSKPSGGPQGTGARSDAAGPWRIDDDISVRFTEAGRTVTFVAVNAGFVARNPSDLQVETSYPGGLASSYAFGCVGGKRTAGGFRPLRRLVDPGDEVLVRCPDTVRLNGQPARLPPEVIDVVVRPRSEAGGPTGG